MKCYIATKNEGKAKELQFIGEQFFPEIEKWIVRAPKNAEETGRTFAENAKIKADALIEDLKSEGENACFVLADDSGLEVESLDGAPGVKTARYAGEHVEPAKHIELLLNNLRPFKSLDDREANYACALHLVAIQGDTKKEYSAVGTCEGFIGIEPKGDLGIGYDSVFLLMDKVTGISEIGEKEKNEISHRWDAFEQITDLLKEQTH